MVLVLVSGNGIFLVTPSPSREKLVLWMHSVFSLRFVKFFQTIILDHHGRVQMNDEMRFLAIKLSNTKNESRRAD
jgi:hypothetical protein